MNFQNESPIKNGRATSTDIELIDRIIAQLQSALHEIHAIFFSYSVKEKMDIIEVDRKLKKSFKKKVRKKKLL